MKLIFLNHTFSTCSWYGEFHYTQNPKTRHDGNDRTGRCLETTTTPSPPQRVQLGFCVLWRLKLYKKKIEEKQSTSVFQEHFGCFFVWTHNRNLILVACCYCRFTDLLLDGRPGGSGVLRSFQTDRSKFVHLTWQHLKTSVCFYETLLPSEENCGGWKRCHVAAQDARAFGSGRNHGQIRVRLHLWTPHHPVFRRLFAPINCSEDGRRRHCWPDNKRGRRN